MQVQFEIHDQAEAKLREMRDEDSDRIISKLEEMVSNEFRRLGDYDVERVQQCSEVGVLRTRIGDWRVFFTRNDYLIRILAVKDRDSAYAGAAQIQQRATEFPA